jgi:hypothetical protein
MARFRMRDIQDLSRIFTTLLDREVSVGKGDKLAMGPRDGFVVAVYAINKRSVVGACALDLSLAASLAGGLSMFPSTVVDTVKTSGRFDDTLWENLFDVLNVSCRFFGGTQSGQVELHKLYLNPKDLPTKVLSYMNSAKFRIDARLAVEGYSDGTMAMFG